MDAGLKELVRRRAGDRWECCHLPQDATPFITFHIEPVIAKQHTPGDEDMENPNPARFVVRSLQSVQRTEPIQR